MNHERACLGCGEALSPHDGPEKAECLRFHRAESMRRYLEAQSRGCMPPIGLIVEIARPPAKTDAERWRERYEEDEAVRVRMREMRERVEARKRIAAETSPVVVLRGPRLPHHIAHPGGWIPEASFRQVAEALADKRVSQQW